MARRLEYTMRFDAPAAILYREYTRRDFHETAMAEFRKVTPVSEVTDFWSGEAGTDIAFKHYVPPSYLPPLVRAVLPDLIVIREQHIDPFDPVANRADGTFQVSIPATAAELSGTYSLAAPDASDAAGSVLELDTECTIRIPLIGRILEQLVAANFHHFFEWEQAFIADWIAARV